MTQTNNTHNLFYNITKNAISIVLDAESFLVPQIYTEKYKNVIEALKNKDINKLKNILNPAKAIEEYSGNRLSVECGVVYLDGKPFSHVVANRIIERMRAGLDALPLLNFLEKLLKNPSKRSVDQFYTFLEQHNFAFADDGDFIAYKGVHETTDGRLVDCHTHTVPNDVGCKPEMPRNSVDDNADSPCSTGFHCSTLEFAQHYGNAIILVKVNPADVVSVPKDASCHKLRVCKYEVIAKVPRR